MAQKWRVDDGAEIESLATKKVYFSCSMVIEQFIQLPTPSEHDPFK